MLQPTLLHTPDGKLVIQVTKDGYSAALPLPNGLKEDEHKLREYLDMVVPDMVAGLVSHITSERRKARRRHAHQKRREHITGRNRSANERDAPPPIRPAGV